VALPEIAQTIQGEQIEKLEESCLLKKQQPMQTGQEWSQSAPELKVDKKESNKS
jgi:hypothetical protein